MTSEEIRDQEKQNKLEEIRKEIINMQAETISLKSQADKLIGEAQELSARRLDKLEKMQILARQYDSIKKGQV